MTWCRASKIPAPESSRLCDCTDETGCRALAHAMRVEGHVDAAQEEAAHGDPRSYTTDEDDPMNCDTCHRPCGPFVTRNGVPCGAFIIDGRRVCDRKCEERAKRKAAKRRRRKGWVQLAWTSWAWRLPEIDAAREREVFEWPEQEKKSRSERTDP